MATTVIDRRILRRLAADCDRVLLFATDGQILAQALVPGVLAGPCDPLAAYWRRAHRVAGVAFLSH